MYLTAMAPPGGAVTVPISSTAASGFGKVFWFGRHSRFKDASGQRMGAPLGKLHKEGIRELEKVGWTKVDCETPLMPVFALTSRQGGDFGMDEAGHAGAPRWPLVRQLPQALTALLDDKRELHRTLSAAGVAGAVAPETLGDVAEALSDEWVGNTDPAALWFLKHRRGVKGQAVHPLQGAAAVRTHVARLAPAARGDYVLQRGVGQPPGARGAGPHLRSGRRWCLRVHLLEVAGRGVSYPHGAPRAYVHSDVIALPHAAAQPAGDGGDGGRVPRCGDRAALVQQVGRAHPKPWLLGAQEPALAARVWPGITALAADTVRAFRARAAAAAAGGAEGGTDKRREGERGEPGACAGAEARGAQLYHLFGLDVLLDADERPWLLEANSYPALHSGTMAAVDAAVYTALVHDVLGLLVLPALPPDDAALPPPAARPGGFQHVA